jgi:hypothetical protein
MIRISALALLPLLSSPSSEGLRSPVIPAVDVTTIPASAAEMAQQISSSKVSLAQAIAAAMQAAGGVAGSAQIVGPKGAPAYEVAVFADGKAYLVVVDGQTGAVRSKTEVPRFPGEATKGEWVESPSGLKSFELRAGTGEKPPSPTATVKVHYTGWLLDGWKFDSSYDRNAPATFALNRVIRGWTEGVGDMRVGEKCKFIVPPSLGFGDQPPPRTGIPPKATLVFDVELLEIVK